MEALEDSVSRLKEIDVGKVDREALLPLADLARFYGYSSDYLRNLVNRGKIKGQKKGKTWYVRVKDLAEYIEHFKPDRRKK